MAGDFLEFGAIQFDPRLLAGVGDAERRLIALGEGLLAAFGLQEEVVQHLGIVHRVGVEAGLRLEFLGQMDDHGLVPERTAEAVIAAGAEDADQPVLDLDHCDVERAAAEVVDKHGLIVGLL